MVLANLIRANLREGASRPGRHQMSESKWLVQCDFHRFMRRLKELAIYKFAGLSKGRWPDGRHGC